MPLSSLERLELVDRGSIALETCQDVQLFQIAKPCREEVGDSRVWAALGPGLDFEISMQAFLANQRSGFVEEGEASSRSRLRRRRRSSTPVFCCVRANMNHPSHVDFALPQSRGAAENVQIGLARGGETDFGGSLVEPT